MAQIDTALVEKRDMVDFNGYIKNMQIFTFAKDLDDIANDNLIHNRLNLKLFPHKNLTFAVEARTRIFTGESIEASPIYSELLDIDNGLVDMSWVLVDEPALIMLTQLDRAWLEWSNAEWEIRLGRQRINWGTNLFWNSNDLFNVYSIVEFDYEERPGSDALRVQRHFKDMSSLEFAFSAGDEDDEQIAALMYRFNKKQYDFQVLIAEWYDDHVVGVGWAGNLWQAGFKGETSVFVPTEEGRTSVSTSISVDYVFANQLFLTGGLLYNNAEEEVSILTVQNPFERPLSAKRLMPNEFSAIISGSIPITPIFSSSLTAIYGTGTQAVFIMPSLGYSMSDNWELGLFGQSFWYEQPSLENIGNGVFVRVKGSF